MHISDDLLIQLDGLGIDTSCPEEELKAKVSALYERVKDHTFGYLERVESVDRRFETVYGMEHFIMVRELHNAFMKEYYGARLKALKDKAYSHQNSETQYERQRDR